MKILVAPDSFKGTYSAQEVADGIQAVGAVPIWQPAANGGEGTLAALAKRLALETVTAPTVDPWGVAIDASYGVSPTGIAVVEVAAAGGYHSGKVGHPGAAVHASSYGTGVLIADAVCRDTRQVIVAAGGSASTDGGLGVIQAIRDRGCMSRARLTVLTDVATTFGDAASVFAPQKGATPADVAVFTKRLTGLAITLPRDPSTIAGSGAAGGLAGGLWSVFDAELRSGREYVLDVCDFDESVAASTAVIVGEGRFRPSNTVRQADQLSSVALDPAPCSPSSVRPPRISGPSARHFAAIYLARNPPKRAGPVWQSLSICSADPPIHQCAVVAKDLLPGQGVDSRHGNR